MSDTSQFLLSLLGAVLIAYAVILLLGMGVWAYRDIKQRTHDGWAQAFAVGMVVLFNILGLVLYLILRPNETLTETYERRLETEALLRELPEQRACSRCDRVARDDFLLCPHCRTVLREPCLGCGRTLELEWAICPYCGAQGPQSIRSGATASAPPPVLQQQTELPTDGASEASKGKPKRAAGTTSQSSYDPTEVS
ncbi:MAG: zinc ribbon domain-containing protein [Dehalococcoidia bacterium]